VWTKHGEHSEPKSLGAEGLSARCGGQGVTVFDGMANPVRVPQIGPARALESAGP
jgi:hypothetical protein